MCVKTRQHRFRRRQLAQSAVTPCAVCCPMLCCVYSLQHVPLPLTTPHDPLVLCVLHPRSLSVVQPLTATPMATDEQQAKTKTKQKPQDQEKKSLRPRPIHRLPYLLKMISRSSSVVTGLSLHTNSMLLGGFTSASGRSPIISNTTALGDSKQIGRAGTGACWVAAGEHRGRSMVEEMGHAATQDAVPAKHSQAMVMLHLDCSVHHNDLATTAEAYVTCVASKRA